MKTQKIMKKENFKKGTKMNRKNRKLTNNDLKNAGCVFVQIYADDHYPFFLKLSDNNLNNLKNIDTDNTRQVTNWRFYVHSKKEGSVEYKELSDCTYINDHETIFDIIIG